ncbi:MAG: hypothetical protein ABL921_14985 [Pirellula sp.]
MNLNLDHRAKSKPSQLGLALACLCFAIGMRSVGFSADKANDGLAIKPEHGPWLIMAMSFHGDDAKIKAEKLATELRRDHKLQAYCLNKRFDFTKPLEGAGFDEAGRERRMKYRDPKVIDSYAVLVGDFDSIDSTAITDTLTKIKKINPKAVGREAVVDTKANSVDVHWYRNYLKKVLPTADGSAKDAAIFGPMENAFVTRNPLLPADFYKAPEVDRFIKKINDEKGLSEFNLLACPGKFSVRVAFFQGDDVTVSWGRQSSLNKEEREISQLDLAAEKAALTTKALRRAGYEAYQYHDRTQSYVTVGSFNELGKVDQQNRFTYDPGIQEIINRFGATKQVTRTQYGSSQTPTLLFDLVDQKLIPELGTKDSKALSDAFSKLSVAFDLKPAPMAVPRLVASGIYGGSLLGKDRR